MIRALLRTEGSPSAGSFARWTLRSHFQPIFRPVMVSLLREVGSLVLMLYPAIGHAARRLESGMPLALAASAFLELPGAERCYVLDGNGSHIDESMLNPRHAGVADPRFNPLKDAKGANWSRRYYFRRALEHPVK